MWCVYASDFDTPQLLIIIIFTAQQNQPIVGGREELYAPFRLFCSIKQAVNIGVYICTHLTDKQLVLLGLRSERLCGVNNEFPLAVLVAVLQIAAMCFNTIRRTELFRVL